jgi:hypothetical protein
VVVIDLLQEAAAIVADDLDRNADFASDCWMKVAHSEMSSPHGAGSRRSEKRVPPAPA